MLLVSQALQQLHNPMMRYTISVTKLKSVYGNGFFPILLLLFLIVYSHSRLVVFL